MSTWIKTVWSLRAQSGVLQLTLGISLIIAILCSSIILIMYYARLNWLQQSIDDQVRSNALSGIQYGMSNRANLPYSESEVRDLFGDEADSVEVIRKPWGLFEVVVSKAWRAKRSIIRSALITAQPDDIGKAVLYTPDNNAPLYLVGNTTITGTAYLSERKLNTGYIDGKDYQGKKLLYGEMQKSESMLPELDTTMLHEISLIFKEKPLGYRLNALDNMPFNTYLSFQSSETNYYFSEQSIDLEDSLGGNIIVHSSMKVRVTAQASLHDIIILAPIIDIDKGFNGSIQCFATRMINVGSESKLLYPSSLVLLGEDQDSTVIIRHDAIVEGLVILKGYDRTLSSKGVLKVEKNAVLHGMAYINGAADIKGKIWGHITARTFQASAGSSIYGNHLLDAELNADKRSKHMPASLWWANTKELTIAKWLQ